MDYIFTIILGIVEGLTEFLPISSTGHLLVASALLNFPRIDQGNFRVTFDIFIQIGAVFAVLIYFRNDLLQQARKITSDRVTQRFWLNVLIAFVPAAVVGILLNKFIDEKLTGPVTIALALIVGGVIFLLIEAQPRNPATKDLTKISPLQALLVGVAQITSLFPGVSRSGSTMVGGMLVDMDRPTATRFSFYLFIPTLGAATVYKLYSAAKDHALSLDQLPLLALGTAVAFVVSWLSIDWLLKYVANHSFRAFGIYRIVAGIVILALVLLKVIA